MRSRSRPAARRVVEVVLETGQEEAELAIALRRGPPVKRGTGTPAVASGVANISAHGHGRIPSAKSVDVGSLRIRPALPTATGPQPSGRTRARAMRAARALLGARMTPAARRVRLLRGRVPAGSASVPHTEATTARPRPAAAAAACAALDGRHEAPAGSAWLAVAEDDVEQDHGGRRIGRRRPRSCSLRNAEVDHRVRPAHGVLVVAEVDHPWDRASAPSIGGQDQLRLAGQSVPPLYSPRTVCWPLAKSSPLARLAVRAIGAVTRADGRGRPRRRRPRRRQVRRVLQRGRRGSRPPHGWRRGRRPGS